MYLRLAAQSSRWFDFRDQAAFNSFDPRSAERGLDESIRQGAVVDNDLWRLWVALYMRDRNEDLMHRTFRHLLETDPVLPAWFSEDGMAVLEGRIHEIHLWFREGKRELGEPMSWSY